MAEGEPLHEARALLIQFARSPLKSLHVRTPALELFASRDPAIRFADTIASAVAPKDEGGTIDLLAPHVGTIARLAALGTRVTAGESYGALAVLDDERPLVAERAGTIAAHRREIGALVECGEPVAALAE